MEASHTLWHMPQESTTEWFSGIVAIVLQFKLCSTHYIQCYECTKVREVHLQSIQKICKSDDLHAEAMTHPLQVNTNAVVGKETRYRGG